MGQNRDNVLEMRKIRLTGMKVVSSETGTLALSSPTLFTAQKRNFPRKRMIFCGAHRTCVRSQHVRARAPFTATERPQIVVSGSVLGIPGISPVQSGIMAERRQLRRRGSLLEDVQAPAFNLVICLVVAVILIALLVAVLSKKYVSQADQKPSRPDLRGNHAGIQILKGRGMPLQDANDCRSPLCDWNTGYIFSKVWSVHCFRFWPPVRCYPLATITQFVAVERLNTTWLALTSLRRPLEWPCF